MTGREAAKAGLRGAFCRVVLAFGLPIACLYAALGYEQAVQWLGDLMDLSSEGHHTTAQIGFAVLFAVPAVIWSAFLLLSDADDKWRRLHWLYFCLFAVILLSCYGPMLLLLAAVGVHFAFHLSIHAAFQLRDKEAEYDDVK